MTPSTLTPYQLFQLDRYGDVLPEQTTFTPAGNVEQVWYERQVEQLELTEPNTGTTTNPFA